MVIRFIEIAIIFVMVLCFNMVNGLEEVKCCSKDSDCSGNEQCSNQNCKDACTRHPCAENAICKVGANTGN